MLLKRTVLTIVIVAVVAALFWADHRLHRTVGFNLIFLAIVVFSVEEFYDLARQRGYTPYSVWGMFCAGLMVAADWVGYTVPSEMHWVGVVAFVFLCGLFILQGWLLPRREGLVSMAITAFAIVYVWGLGHFIVRLRYLDPEIIGIRGVLLFVAVVKATDITAYLVGSRWGRHRPFPHVSPNKSWEGYIGGFVASLAVGVLVWWVLFDDRWYWALAFSAPVSVAAHLGDLAESVIKRSLGAKDSAVRFPGLGGMLDLVDSLLLAGPVAFYVLEQMHIFHVL
jgi:phosphatidate cytidylyltransferase